MPRIMITSVDGQPFSITSSNPELLAQWIWETLQLITPNVTCQATVRVDPMWVGNERPNGGPDWPPNMALAFQAQLGANKPTDNVRGLISALQQYASMIDGAQPA